MRLSIPGMPGVYYDTDAESTAITAALTAASRRAPSPHRYGLQALPHLWSIDVDLTEAPNDHPIQYFHPEGARSIEELTRNAGAAEIGRQFDLALRFAWAVNEEAEVNAEKLFGRRDLDEEPSLEGTTIEIEDGTETETEDADEAADGETKPDEEDVAMGPDVEDAVDADAESTGIDIDEDDTGGIDVEDADSGIDIDEVGDDADDGDDD